jgi:hypothetical protein
LAGGETQTDPDRFAPQARRVLFPLLPRERRGLVLAGVVQFGQALLQFCDRALQLFNLRVTLSELGFQLGQANFARINRRFQNVSRDGHLSQSRSLAAARPLSNDPTFPALWHLRTAPTCVER